MVALRTAVAPAAPLFDIVSKKNGLITGREQEKNRRENLFFRPISAHNLLKSLKTALAVTCI